MDFGTPKRFLQKHLMLWHDKLRHKPCVEFSPDYEVPIVLISIDVALKKKAGIPSLFKGPFEPLFLLLLQSLQKILSSLSLKVSLYKLCHWVSGLSSWSSIQILKFDLQNVTCAASQWLSTARHQLPLAFVYTTATRIIFKDFLKLLTAGGKHYGSKQTLKVLFLGSNIGMWLCM